MAGTSRYPRPAQGEKMQIWGPVVDIICEGGGWPLPINMYNGAGCRFQAATGYQAAWLEGRSYWSLVHPADVQGLRGAVARRKRNYI